MPHSFIGMNEEGKASVISSKGNPTSHLILRGGKLKPNYDPASINKALLELEKLALPKRLLIDCSHANSLKNCQNQPTVFESVFRQFQEDNPQIKGMLIESYLKSGKQKLQKKICPETSITDACLDFKTTKEMILKAYCALDPTKSSEAICQWETPL